MYRRYSPQNANAQGNIPSTAQEHSISPPSPGVPKSQWAERQQSAQNPAHFSNQTQNHHSNVHNDCNPLTEQHQAPREYRDATLNAGRRPGNLNFQPKQERTRKQPPPPPKKKHPLLGFLPPSVYNPETKKIFGFLETEDLLLAALILMLLENEEQENSLLVYALLYVLLGDKLDLSKFGLSSFL